MKPGPTASRAIFFGGQLTEALMPLARNIILARLLIPEQFGLAVALSVVVAVAIQVSDLGFERSIVRSPEGREDVRRDTLHTLNLLRGLVLALGLVAISPFLADWVEAPDAAWAFATLGLATLIHCGQNLGAQEVARQYVFWKHAADLAIQQLCWTALVGVLYFVFEDYRAMLFAIIGGQVALVISSHILSPTPWRPRLDRESAREVLAYGMPLMPNGIALAAKTQADRLIVASLLGLSTMAVYSAVVMAALMPRNIIQRMMTTVFVPYFVNAGVPDARRSRLFEVYAFSLSLIAAAYCLAFLIIGEPAVGFVFGDHYRPDQLLVDLVALNIVAKLMLGLIVVPALAYGNTRLILIGSIGGLVALGCGAGAVLVHPTLESMLIGLTAMEMLVLPITVYAVVRQYEVRGAGLWLSILTPVLIVAAGIAVMHTWPPADFLERVVMLAIALAAAAAVFLAVFQALGLSPRHMARVILRRTEKSKDAAVSIASA